MSQRPCATAAPTQSRLALVLAAGRLQTGAPKREREPEREPSATERLLELRDDERHLQQALAQRRVDAPQAAAALEARGVERGHR